MTEPITIQQDHDRRLGRLEGIAEQTAQAIIDLRQDIRELRTRMDGQFRWLIGIQIASLITIGGLLLNILSKLPG